ncbi:hypothetical protein O6P43_014813 [Quillaja saponaria]|uniref:Uncharacterized protein n=1 Tax=Quillaja saponaria TaxID=32244 RepID=A0AAD7LXZ3_QUISA|nr:hypothetical protein O6P43_014813 [Quillaja saponaria]
MRKASTSLPRDAHPYHFTAACHKNICVPKNHQQQKKTLTFILHFRCQTTDLNLTKRWQVNTDQVDSKNAAADHALVATSGRGSCIFHLPDLRMSA